MRIQRTRLTGHVYLLPIAQIWLLALLPGQPETTPKALEKIRDLPPVR